MHQNEQEHLTAAIEAVRKNGRFFCKFLSANDSGANGSHQDGIYLSMAAWKMFFHDPVPDMGILERTVKIHIGHQYPFESRLVYYTSKKEYRITQFWSNAPFERKETTGALIVFVPVSPDDFEVFLFNSEEPMEEFIETFSISITNNFFVFDQTLHEQETQTNFEGVISSLVSGFDDFPPTEVMAVLARKAFTDFHKPKNLQPDNHLIKWIDTEYAVFRSLEQMIYKDKLTVPFGELQPLLDFASSALNRRKSRAGRSLEHHVSYLFDAFKLDYCNPGKTEGRKKPDFLFPSSVDYANPDFPEDQLILLGAKTTCKDRWRQVLSEGARVKNKHLITLQQGISKNQMDEMQEAGLQLVVPKPYHKQYPKEYKDRLWSVEQFISFVKDKKN